MTAEKYIQLLAKYIDRQFVNKLNAALAFKCSPATVSQVINGNRSPIESMLQATGHERIDKPATVDYRKVTK